MAKAPGRKAVSGSRFLSRRRPASESGTNEYWVMNAR